MSRKDQILHDALEKSSLLTKYRPDSFLWNLITGCMQSYVEEQEIASVILTIEDVTEIKASVKKKKVSSCEHDWLRCSDQFWTCNNCPEWKEL